MTTREEIPTLDDVLTEFVAEHERPTREALQEWIARYPQYERELVDFAAAWAEQQALPPADELGAEAEKILVDRAMSHVQNVAYSQRAAAAGSTTDAAPLIGLVAEAKKVGLSAAELTRECGLDLALIAKLDKRQIRPRSIPPCLIARLSELLRRSVDAIEAFLAGAPRVRTGQAFLARGKPHVTGQQSFADAVRGSSLSREAKARWLAEAAGLDEES